jgi:hypothetical protein
MVFDPDLYVVCIWISAAFNNENVDMYHPKKGATNT